MGRGIKQQAEWVGGETRRSFESKRQVLPEPTLTPIWPYLSVIRQPKTRDNSGAYDWHEFLDELGIRNRAKGTARALGSSAISLITGKEMDMMLKDKYPNDCRTAKDISKLQRKIGSKLKDFVSTQSVAAQLTKIETVADDHYQRRGQYEDDLEDYTIFIAPMDEDFSLSNEEQIRIQEHTFGETTFPARSLGLFGRGYGVDLSDNEQLHEERDQLARFCRKELLDTSKLDSDWQPHARVFDFHDHLKLATIVHQVRMPQEITFSHAVVMNS